MSCIVYFKEKVNGTLHLLVDSSVFAGGLTLVADASKLINLVTPKRDRYLSIASVGPTRQQNMLESVILAPSMQEELSSDRVESLFCTKSYKQELKQLAVTIIGVYSEYLKDDKIEEEDRGEIFIAIRGEIFLVDSQLAVVAPLVPFYATGAPGDTVNGILLSMTSNLEEDPTGQKVEVMLRESFSLASQWFRSSILEPFTHVEQKGKPHAPLLKIM